MLAKFDEDKMNRTTITAAIAAALLGTAYVLPSDGTAIEPAAAVPDLPPPSPGPFPPEPGPEPEPQPATRAIPVDPTHVGIVRTDDGAEWVELVRPVGAAATCTRTVCDARIGEQWTSRHGPNYVLAEDGSWYEYRTQPRRVVSRIVERTVAVPVVQPAIVRARVMRQNFGSTGGGGVYRYTERAAWATGTRRPLLLRNR